MINTGPLINVRVTTIKGTPMLDQTVLAHEKVKRSVRPSKNPRYFDWLLRALQNAHCTIFSIWLLAGARIVSLFLSLRYLGQIATQSPFHWAIRLAIIRLHALRSSLRDFRGYEDNLFLGLNCEWRGRRGGDEDILRFGEIICLERAKFRCSLMKY